MTAMKEMKVYFCLLDLAIIKYICTSVFTILVTLYCRSDKYFMSGRTTYIAITNNNNV